MYEYKTKGVCSTQVNFEIAEDNTIKNIEFVRGCDGNLKGLAKLAIGQDGKEVIEKLEGITCGKKGSSCPDQLACALKAYYNEQ